MKIFGFDINIRRAKNSAPVPEQTANWTGLFRYNPKMTISELLSNSTVNACVGIISDAVAVLPLNIYKKLDNESREKDVKNPVYSVMKHSVNFYQKPFTFKKQIMTHLLLKGNAFIFVERTGDRVTALYALDPQRMEIKKFPDRNEYYYVYHSDSGDFKYTRDRILHIPAMVWNGVWGLSPIEYASRTPQLGNTLDEYTSTVFDGGIHSKLLVTVPKEERSWKKEDTETLEARLVAAYGGSANAHKPLILSHGLSATPLNLSSNGDSQLVENRTYTVKEIAKIFRVPLSMLGESDAKYNNNEQQQRNFLNSTLAPWLVLLEEYFQQLLPVYERNTHYFEFDTNAMTRADSTQRIANYEREIANGMLSLNDVNRMENRPLLPAEIGDVRFIPVNRMPLTKENIDAYMANQKQKVSGGKTEPDEGGDGEEPG